MEESDAAARLRLARLARARGDETEAGRWATRTLRVEVLNAEAHGILAASLVASARFEPAVEEYETAIRLDTKRQEWLLGLARSCARTGRSERAREALRDLLETDPEYPGARELLDTLP
jgi:Flp pilus assembly protein TadD